MWILFSNGKGPLSKFNKFNKKIGGCAGFMGVEISPEKQFFSGDAGVYTTLIDKK